MKTKHSSIEKEFVCETCGIKCKSLTSLKKHKQSHSEGPFTCEFCHKLFKFQTTLATHVKSHHRQGLLTKVFSYLIKFLISHQACVFCSKQFAYAEQSKLDHRLERHLSNHRRIFQKKKFKCQFCIFGADSEADISKHICHRDEISDISGVQITEPTSVIAENPLFKVHFVYQCQVYPVLESTIRGSTRFGNCATGSMLDTVRAEDGRFR